jgi:hypothetical protein
MASADYDDIETLHVARRLAQRVSRGTDLASRMERMFHVEHVTCRCRTGRTVSSGLLWWLAQQGVGSRRVPHTLATNNGSSSRRASPTTPASRGNSCWRWLTRPRPAWQGLARCRIRSARSSSYPPLIAEIGAGRGASPTNLRDRSAGDLHAPSGPSPSGPSTAPDLPGRERFHSAFDPVPQPHRSRRHAARPCRQQEGNAS